MLPGWRAAVIGAHDCPANHLDFLLKFTFRLGVCEGGRTLLSGSTVPHEAGVLL